MAASASPQHPLFPEAQPDIPLSALTTLQIGGPARWLLSTANPERVVEWVRRCVAHGVPYMVIGGGSNLVAPDEGLDGVVIRFAGHVPDTLTEGPNTQPQPSAATPSTSAMKPSADGAEKISLRDKANEQQETLLADEPAPPPRIEQNATDGSTALIVAGSFPYAALPQAILAAGCVGMEWASGIPGTVGGAVYGNAGAWGAQIGDRVTALRLLDPQTGHDEWQPASAVTFGYRDSSLKRSRHIVLQVRLRVEKADNDTVAAARAECERILTLRREKHPNLHTDPSAGSFFQNLAPTSAAQRRQAAGGLLEQCGCKGLRVGGAMVFPKHANIVVNAGGATADDVRKLTGEMRFRCRTTFHVELQPEVAIVAPRLTVFNQLRTLDLIEPTPASLPTPTSGLDDAPQHMNTVRHQAS